MMPSSQRVIHNLSQEPLFAQNGCPSPGFLRSEIPSEKFPQGFV